MVGQRPRHVPERSCVVCRQKTAKRDLVRLVRTPQGAVVLDPTGKMSGRGAYLCRKQECWAKALKGKRLDLALKSSITPEKRSELESFAAGLGPVSSDEGTERQGRN